MRRHEAQVLSLLALLVQKALSLLHLQTMKVRMRRHEAQVLSLLALLVQKVLSLLHLRTMRVARIKIWGLKLLVYEELKLLVYHSMRPSAK
jgi:hypothetical protein